MKSISIRKAGALTSVRMAFLTLSAMALPGPASVHAGVK
jgi:hypothetical protein